MVDDPGAATSEPEARPTTITLHLEVPFWLWTCTLDKPKHPAPEGRFRGRDPAQSRGATEQGVLAHT
jgi:hypothetical protein